MGMKKIVLFSPTGYIGAFIKKAFQQEETVQLYEIVRGSDLTQYNGQYDIMVYSASVSAASAEKYVQDNVVAAITMVRFCVEHRVKRIVYLSTDSIYGEIDTDMVSERAVMVNPGIYGTTKYLAEQIIAESGIPFYILRLPSVVGGIWRRNFISDLMLRIMNNEYIELYNLEKYFNNLLYIDDLIKFIVLLCSREEDHRTEIFLLGNEEKMKLEEVVSYIQLQYGSTSQIRNIKDDHKRYFTLDVSKAVKYGYSSIKIREILDKLYQLQRGGR